MVEWLSGLKRCPAKTFAAKAAQGFESLLYRQIYNGNVAERFKALAWKASGVEKLPKVRILSFPPFFNGSVA